MKFTHLNEDGAAYMVDVTAPEIETVEAGQELAVVPLVG